MSNQEAANPSNTTHFLFEHSVFGLEGAYFEADGNSKKAKYVMPFSDEMAAVTLDSLKKEFEIGDDSKDGELLDTVNKSLKYMQMIRPGDNIPCELLDGSASWSVEEHHRAAARDRLKIQLATMMKGKEEHVIDRTAIEQLVDDPEINKRVQEAFGVIAEKMGLEPKEKTQVVHKIEQLGHELSFIEGLRECYERIASIQPKAAELIKHYGNQTGTWADLNRVRALLRDAVEDSGMLLEILDAQTCEILIVLQSFDTYVQQIRETRDEMHSKFVDWKEVLDAWDKIQVNDRNDEADAAVKLTYRFLARKYPQQDNWTLQNQAG